MNHTSRPGTIALAMILGAFVCSAGAQDWSPHRGDSDARSTAKVSPRRSPIRAVDDEQSIEIIPTAPGEPVGRSYNDGRELTRGEFIQNGRVIRDGDVIYEGDFGPAGPPTTSRPMIHPGPVLHPAPTVPYDVPPVSCEGCAGGCADCNGFENYPTSGCDGCVLGCDQCVSPMRARHHRRALAIGNILANPMADTWVRAEYQQMFFSGQDVLPLVTTSTAATPLNNAGVLGLPSTSVLFGGGEINDDSRAGGRFEYGRWLMGTAGYGLSVSYLFAEDDEESFTASSERFGILARPFADVLAGGNGNNSELVAFPGQLSGNISVHSVTEFDAADVLLRKLWIDSTTRRLQTFYGYQYIGLDDDLSIRDNKTSIGGGGGLVNGTNLIEEDRFTTDNDFHGFAMGLQHQRCFGLWRLDTTFQMGLGVTNSTVTASGSTVTTVPVPGQGVDLARQNSGLLVQGSNAGSREEDEFAVTPQIRLLLERDLPWGWDASIGYQFLYWSRVQRAGDQIDPLLNLSQLSAAGLNGIGRPAPTGAYEDLTVQSILFGVRREF